MQGTGSGFSLPYLNKRDQNTNFTYSCLSPGDFNTFFSYIHPAPDASRTTLKLSQTKKTISKRVIPLSDGSLKMMTIHKLTNLLKQELMDLADVAGISNEGKKQELVERLRDFFNDPANASQINSTPKLSEVYNTPSRRTTRTAGGSGTPSRKFTVGDESDAEESDEEGEGDLSDEVTALNNALEHTIENARNILEDPSEVISTLKRVPSQALLQTRRVAKQGKKSIVKKSNKVRSALSTFYAVPIISIVLELLSLVNGAYHQSWSRADSVWWGFTPFATWIVSLVLFPLVTSYYMNYTKGSKRVSFDPLTFAITRSIILYGSYSLPASGLTCQCALAEIYTFLQVSIPHMRQSIGQLPYISSLAEIIIIIAARH